MKYNIVKIHDSLYELLVCDNDSNNSWKVVAHGKYESMKALEKFIVTNPSKPLNFITD